MFSQYRGYEDLSFTTESLSLSLSYDERERERKIN